MLPPQYQPGVRVPIACQEAAEQQSVAMATHVPQTPAGEELPREPATQHPAAVSSGSNFEPVITRASLQTELDWQLGKELGYIE